ncbi:crotonobetainyl-CoA:carnitine CoA-transferase CaiB-like acyl-CoA transferase [Pseudochelatococcus lubricantis]|uniref:Crotonobetainyl-CoA:carnitine CoA-transferase CaiB-like acyl-CoA transferase n=1 Tax=Pseudochelatococcus lubricantis TaxID=1538102 RepID=A0ABX0UTS7_9HYPH|nr:CaiB/BaiF CoA-transferase family protein [Pseudochelatococcus lubricantis]NIJ56366.1 crotonobetainyl-CoA:carnitine CoA-transferase CaiB-like acyl-CoA transferase [Pseudochelatococcus lubricantis]
MRPLEGLLVLDFSTLLPGPLASLVLAEAGARVVKIERPGRGDEMRSYEPKLGEDSVNFAMLNRGKQSIAIDLKAAGAVDELVPLIRRADVLIEQFRPGVMERLGLGYDTVRHLNSKLVYCSITGWGQNGPKAQTAAHDLNYVAETGMLGLTAGADGAPVLPPVLAADIAGGALPGVVNILLALRQRDITGFGSYLDIAMGDNLFTFLYWGLGAGFAGAGWPRPSADLVTGGSPRYQIYRTADGRYLAAAPIEDKFWENFTRIIGLPDVLRGAGAPAAQVRAAVAERIAGKTAAEWQALMAGRDVCCSIVATLEEAVADPHVAARRLFDHTLMAGGRELPAVPVPIAPVFRAAPTRGAAPGLGETTDPLLSI